MISEPLKSMIETIALFEDCNKYFWIDKLNTCDSNKGFIILYFNLLNGGK